MIPPLPRLEAEPKPTTLLIIAVVCLGIAVYLLSFIQ